MDHRKLLSNEGRALARSRPFPEWIDPMLATLTRQRFSDPGWIFEPKWDGERCLAYRNGKKIKLFSRNRLALNGHYPEIVKALERQPTDRFVIDGEVVAFQGSVTSFAQLQQRIGISDPKRAQAQGITIYYYVFDVLYADGDDLQHVPLIERKAVLEKILRYADPLRLTPFLKEEGEAFYKKACQSGWEGIIAKRASTRYQSARSPDWLKFKCVNVSEFVIGGYTNPQGSRAHFGALLIGYYDEEGLKYAGKVGTGYTEKSLRLLSDQMKPLEVAKNPFVSRDVPRRDVHWVKPELVAQINFSEWTTDGKLRHPAFSGLRRDKAASEVVRERSK